MNDKSLSRRTLIKLGCTALAAIPVLCVTGRAFAATNAGLRKSFNYKDSPKDGKNCLGCGQFVPGASPTAPGGCKVIPGDTEIAPNGYCDVFVAKK
jgi:hypothetical protein